MKITFPVAIYPSQLNSFKEKANHLAETIAKALSINKLSAFKRNDYLSIGLGYKGHNDLIKSAKFREQADNDKPLLLFSVDQLKHTIAEVFSSKVEGLTSEQALALCKELEPSEIGSVMLSDLRNAISGSVSDKETESVVNNANPGFKLFWDEPLESAASTQETATFLREAEAKGTPKKCVPHITIDVSEVPLAAYDAFVNHPVTQEFRQHSHESSNEVTSVFIPQNANSMSRAANWKIRVSIDAWAKSELDNDLLQHWERFKDWLMQFMVTERIHVTERIKDHRWLTMHTQYHPNTTLENIRKKLSSASDRALLDSLIDVKPGMYGHIFEAGTSTVDLLDVINSKDVVYVQLDALKDASTGKGKSPMSDLIENQLESQQSAIAREKAELEQRVKASPGKTRTDLCEHKVFDSYGDIESGAADHKCLVCGHQWSEGQRLIHVMALDGKDYAMLNDYEREAFHYWWQQGRKHGMNIKIHSDAPQDELDGARGDKQRFQIIERYPSNIEIIQEKTVSLTSEQLQDHMRNFGQKSK